MDFGRREPQAVQRVTLEYRVIRLDEPTWSRHCWTGRYRVSWVTLGTWGRDARLQLARG